MLKMAPNSLFAILLRSPWWISVGIALVFALASKALLPAEYWLFGAMGGFPFTVIGAMSAWKQLQWPSPRRVEAIVQAVSAMPWRDFATALENAWTAAGYRVQRSEGAADSVLSRDGRTTLVNAKRWKAARHGEEAVQTLAARMQALDASAGLYVALGELSAQAQQLARQQRIDVLDGPALSVVLARMPLK